MAAASRAVVRVEASRTAASTSTVRAAAWPDGGLPGGGYEGEDGRPTPPWLDDDDQGEDDEEGDDDQQGNRDPAQEEQGQDQGDDA